MEEKEFIIMDEEVFGIEEVTKVKPDDILIVELNDGFFDIQRPIFAHQLQDYETPITLLEKKEDGTYETWQLKQPKNVEFKDDQY